MGRQYLATSIYLAFIAVLIYPPAVVLAFLPLSLGRHETDSAIATTSTSTSTTQDANHKKNKSRIAIPYIATTGTATSQRRREGVSPLHQSNIDITTPNPDDAADLGARDWPQRLRRGPGWSERVAEEQVATRYILDGSGSVSVSLLNKAGGTVISSTSRTIGPGTLIEITGPAEVDWTVDAERSSGDEGEMIVLTPGYEEAGLLVGVAAAFVVLCGVLVATAGG